MMIPVATRRIEAVSEVSRQVWLMLVLLALALTTAVLAPPAPASVGYELNPSHPSRAVTGIPRGLAVDQTSQDIYLAIVSSNPALGTPGGISRFNSDLTADGTFASGSGYYTGVAVDPLTQNFYGARTRLEIDVGTFGTPRLERFSPSGTLTGSFAFDDTEGMPPMAADSTGRLFYPNAAKHAVLVFSSNGELLEEIKCDACPGGPFGKPESVAFDAADNLYVADLAPDRLLKLTPSAGKYSSGVLMQSGRGAAAVGVDPATGDVLVGDMPNGRDYHIVAYDSSGTQFDDFGAGLFPDPDPGYGAFAAYQMAIDATTHTLYVGESGKFYIFDKTTIKAPTASAKPATEVGQLTAQLNASVSANGHAALECEFEYTDAADTAFASATSAPCSEMPDGSVKTEISVGVSGLSPDTSYRYRVTVTTNASSVTSGSEVFQTLPEVPPTISKESPTNVTQTTATIRANVNPHGGSSSDCHFEFGTNVAYGSTFPCLSLPPPATTDVTVTRKVSGLTANTVYHYRMVVTTNAGTAEGEDTEFTTASVPVEPEPEGPASPTEPGPAPVTSPPPPSGPVTTPSPRRCRRGFHRRRVRGKLRCVRKRHRHRQRSASG